MVTRRTIPWGKDHAMDNKTVLTVAGPVVHGRCWVEVLQARRHVTCSLCWRSRSGITLCACVENNVSSHSGRKLGSLLLFETTNRGNLETWAPDLEECPCFVFFLKKVCFWVCFSTRNANNLQHNRQGGLSFYTFHSLMTLKFGSSLGLTSMLTAYLTPYATLVHQGKGTEYPR